MRGVTNIGIGFALLVVGLLITLGSYSAASGGGIYVVTYGAIAVGAIKILQGIVQLVRDRTKAMAARSPRSANRAGLAVVAIVVIGVGAGFGYYTYVDSTGYLARQMFVQSPDSSGRRAALERLATRDEPAAIDALVFALDDRDTYVRGQAAAALAALQAGKAVEPLIARLPEQESSVRNEFIKALGQLGDPRAMPVLLAETDSAEGVSSGDYLVGALSHFGPDMAPEMIARLSSPSPRTRGVAVSVLRGMSVSDDPEYAPRLEPAVPLMEGLLYDEEDIATEASIFLAHYADPKARDALVAALGVADGAARETAAAAIAKYMAGGVVVLGDAFGGTDSTTRLGAAYGLGELAAYGYVSQQDRAAAKDVLDKAVATGDTAAGCGGYSYFIKSARLDALDFLVGALNACGDPRMAERFLNSGQDQLASAGEAWGLAHGYSVTNDGGAVDAGQRWGGLR